MNSNISPQDWEALSAYIDNQLSVNERSQLELRLGTDVELRRTLQEMKRIKVTLGNAPRRRAPRNFTLSPGKAGIRLSSPLYPTFRLASVLASIMFVLVFLGDMLTGITTGVPILAQVARQSAPQLEEMSLAQEVATEEVELPAVMESAADVAATEAPAPPEALMAAPAESTPPPPSAELGVEGQAAKALPTSSPTLTESPTTTPEPTVTPLLTATVVAAELPIQAEQADAAANQQEGDSVGRARFTIPYVNSWIIWGLEGLLLVIAVGAMLAALLTRRMR